MTKLELTLARHETVIMGMQLGSGLLFLERELAEVDIAPDDRREIAIAALSRRMPTNDNVQKDLHASTSARLTILCHVHVDVSPRWLPLVWLQLLAKQRICTG